METIQLAKKIENSFNYLLPKQNGETNKNNKFIELPKNSIPTVIIDDVIDAVKKIPNKSISVIVTSPPYWNLKDYYDNKQIGSEKRPGRLY